jgi:hypothetical protein
MSKIFPSAATDHPARLRALAGGTVITRRLSRLVLKFSRDAVITRVGRLSGLVLELSGDTVITRRLSRLVLELSSDTTDLIHNVTD